MKIIKYEEKYKKQIIDLILHIQNEEARIALTIEEQPDLLDIYSNYEKNGGEFWTAVENDEVIGTIALMDRGNGNSVLKKFFVRKDWRSKKIGYELYKTLLTYVKEKNIKYIVLDTPSVAKVSHKFYERAGFKKITKEELPFEYNYPDRDSYLYLLEIE